MQHTLIQLSFCRSLVIIIYLMVKKTKYYFNTFNVIIIERSFYKEDNNLSRFKKTFFTAIKFICAIGVVFVILFACSFFQGWVNVKEDGTLASSKTPKNVLESKYVPKINSSDMNVSKVSDVKFCFLGKDFSKNPSIYYKAQRYYLPLDKVCSNLGFSFDSSNGIITISKEDFKASINVSSNTISKISSDSKLRGEVLNEDNTVFLSVSDIENIFNLNADFNFKDRTVNFVHNASFQKSDSPKTGRAAFIRLEDFGASPYMQKDTTQKKFKVFADFLGSNNIKFHIAWVPRYKDPENNIDNDLLTNNSIENVGFVNMMDRLILNGGELGLHGYTHQYGNEISFEGTELSKKANASEEETRKVIESGIDTSSALNLPVTFYESPHYKATSKQLKIIEEYFQYLYQPAGIIDFTILRRKGDNLYIPTPLSYVKDLNVKPILRGLNHPLPYQLASLYYHPTKELDFIDVTFTKDEMFYTYDDNAPMKQIIKAIKDNGYVTAHVSDFKN